MNTITDQLGGAPKEKSPDAAFFAGGTNNRGGKAGKKLNEDIECFNCHKKGHKKSDCWAKGGGKEGQGPRSKERKEKVGELKKGDVKLEGHTKGS